MTFDPKQFGLKKFHLYEIIATSYSLIDDGLAIKPNASCMGIRLIEGDHIQISPFYGTTTFRNLKENSIIALNFVDDIYLYALAALKAENSSIGLSPFPTEYFNFKNLKERAIEVPYINKAWGLLIGEVSKESKKIKEDDLGEIVIPVFKLNIIFTEKFQESYKLFNRAENLALESIILATRLKLAKENQDKLLYSKINERIVDNIGKIKKFGRNKKALKAVKLINYYITD